MKQGVIETYEENQLVVAPPDLAVVRGALGDLPVGRHVDPSPGLPYVGGGGLVTAYAKPHY
jgi:hypothetical protein